MSHEATYHIKAIDGITPIYRNLLKLGNKTSIQAVGLSKKFSGVQSSVTNYTNSITNGFKSSNDSLKNQNEILAQTKTKFGSLSSGLSKLQSTSLIPKKINLEYGKLSKTIRKSNTIQFKVISGTKNKLSKLVSSFKKLRIKGTTAPKLIKKEFISLGGIIRKSFSSQNRFISGTHNRVNRLRVGFRKLERRALLVPNRIGRRFGLLKSKIARIGLAIGSYFAFDQVFTFGKNLIKQSSDLGEASNRASTVFGADYGRISKFASKAADDIGISNKFALEASSTFASLFKNIGVAPKGIAGLSETMVRLAGDLASFNNISPEEAVNALRSGLSGETEPLKRFGISLDQTRLKQKALDLGLIKTAKGALPAAIRSQAIYASILDQTKDAQNDFSKTQNEVANKERRNAALYIDTKAALGKALLPTYNKFLSRINLGLKWVQANTKGIVKWTKRITIATGSIVGLWASVKIGFGIVSLFKTIKLGFVALSSGIKIARLAMIGFNAAALMNPFVWIPTAIVGIGLIIYHWDIVKEKMLTWGIDLEAIGIIGEKVLRKLGFNFESLGKFIASSHPFALWFRANKFYINSMVGFVDKMIPGFQNRFNKIASAIKNAFRNAFQWVLKNVLHPIGKLIEKVFDIDLPDSISGTRSINEARRKGGSGRIGLGGLSPANRNKNKKDKSESGNFDFSKGIKLLGFNGLPTGANETTKSSGNPINDKINNIVSGAGKEIKNITINITNLVKELQFITDSNGNIIDENAVKDQLTNILLSVVNDVNYN